MGVLDALRVTVSAYVAGRLRGPAVGLLALADHRYAYPSAIIVLSEPRLQFDGTVAAVTAQEQQATQMLGELASRLAAVTGHDVEQIRSLGMFGEKGPLVGMVAEDLDCGGQLVPGRVCSGHQQRRAECQELVVGQAVAVDLGLHHVGEQIVGQHVTPLDDHVVDVGLEFFPRSQDVGAVVGNVPVEELENVVGPLRELPPVRARCAE